MRCATLLLILLGLYQAGVAEAQQLRVHEILRIGKADSDDERLLFGSIRGVAIDRTGQVFVLDDPSMEVRSFNALGEATIVRGGRGEGPGELLSVNAIAVDDADRLLVMDSRAFRLTRFGPGGSVKTARWEGNAARKIAFVKDIGYVCLVLSPLPRMGRAPIFRVFDDKLVETGSIGDYADTGLLADNFGEASLGFNPGYFAVDRAGVVYYAPYAYAGRVYRFKPNGSGLWEPAGTLTGEVKGEAYTVVDAEHPPADASVIHWGAHKLAAVFRNQGMGIHIMPDGEIWVFSLSTVGGERRPIVEQFGSDGEFRRTLPIDMDVPFIPGSRTAVEFHAFDGKYFYVVDSRNGYPKVRKVEMVEG